MCFRLCQMRREVNALESNRPTSSIEGSRSRTACSTWSGSFGGLQERCVGAMLIRRGGRRCVDSIEGCF